MEESSKKKLTDPEKMETTEAQNQLYSSNQAQNKSLIPRWATLTGEAVYGVTKSSVKLTGSALKEVKQRMQEQLEARQQLLASNQLEEQKAMDKEEIVLMMERMKHADLASDRVANLQSVADLTARQAQTGLWVAEDQLIQAVLEQVRDPSDGDNGVALVQVGMQCLYNLIAVNQDTNLTAVDEHIALFLEAKGVEALVPLLDSRFGPARLDVVQTLRMVLSNSGAQLVHRVEEAVLDCPAGMQQIADLMMAPNEEVRNEALLLLAALTHNCSRPDLQNFLAFQEGFDHLFSIQAVEKDTIISLDCLQTICNVLRGNDLTQKLFLAGNYLPKLVDILNLKGNDLEQSGENNIICVSPIRRAQILLCLRFLYMLIGLEDEEDWQGWGVDKRFSKERQDLLGQEPGLMLALCKVALSGDGMATCEWANKGVGTQERRQALTILSSIVLANEANQAALSYTNLGQDLALTALVEMCSLPSVSLHERTTAEGLFWSFVFQNSKWCGSTLMEAAGKVNVRVQLHPDPPEEETVDPAMNTELAPAEIAPDAAKPDVEEVPAEATEEDPATPQKTGSSWDLIGAEMKSSKKKKKDKTPPAKEKEMTQSQEVPPPPPEENKPNEQQNEQSGNTEGLIGAVGKGLWGSIKWAAKAVDEAVSAEYVKVQAEEELERTRTAIDEKTELSKSPSKPNMAHSLTQEAVDIEREKSEQERQAREKMARCRHALTIQTLFAAALYDPPDSERGSSTTQLSALKLLRWILQNTEDILKQQADSITLAENRVLFCTDYRPQEIPVIQAAVYVLQRACRKVQSSANTSADSHAPVFHKYIYNLCCLLCVWMENSPSIVMTILRNGVNWQIFEIVSQILRSADAPKAHGGISGTALYDLKYTNALIIGYIGMLYDGVRSHKEGSAQKEDIVVTETMFISALQERMDMVTLCDGLQSIETFCQKHKDKSVAADLSFHNSMADVARRTHNRLIELIANPSLAEDDSRPKMASISEKDLSILKNELQSAQQLIVQQKEELDLLRSKVLAVEQEMPTEEEEKP